MLMLGALFVPFSVILYPGVWAVVIFGCALFQWASGGHVFWPNLIQAAAMFGVLYGIGCFFIRQWAGGVLAIVVYALVQWAMPVSWHTTMDIESGADRYHMPQAELIAAIEQAKHGEGACIPDIMYPDLKKDPPERFSISDCADTVA